MTVSLNGTSGIVFNDASTQNTSAFTGGFAFRNRIINGAMVIDQRNAGASVTLGAGGTYTLDRYRCYSEAASKLSIQQVSDAPTGFTNSLKATSLSAYSVGTNEIFGVFQNIEGFNTSDLSFGTATASSVTVSFWAKSSLTGTFGGSLTNSGFTRCYPFTYSINVANTWEYKTVTVVGDTTGTWLTNNSIGISVFFSLGCGTGRSATGNAWTGTQYSFSATGATSVVGTNGATFYITGVQLEKGSTATSFDYRPIGTELALCQRYFQQLPSLRDGTTLVISNFMPGSPERIPMPVLPVQMRAVPTVVSYRVAGTNAGEVTEFSAGTNRVVNVYAARDACGGGYLQCATSFANPAQLNLTYSAEL